MTSSNVSNLFIQVSNISVEMPDSKNATSKSNHSFEMSLKNASTVNAPSAVKSEELPKQSNNESIEVTNSKLSSSKDNQSVKAEDKPEDIKSEVTEKVEETVEKVKDVIEEELDVTEEDIEKAMESLGLTALDLLNPQNLAQIVATLTGEQDSISLVRSDEFKGILDAVTTLTNQLFEDTGFDASQLKEFLITAEEQTVGAIDESIQIEMEEVNTPIDTAEASTPIIQVESEEVQAQNKDLDVTSEADVSDVDSDAKPIIDTEVNTSKADDNSESDESSEFFNKNKNTDALGKTLDKPQAAAVKEDANIVNEPKLEVQFSTEEQVVTLPTGETVKADSIVNQLVEEARVLNTSESTTMEMTLNPEGLGKIFVEVTQKGDEIIAKIFTENDAVKQALESQMANLRVEFNQNSTKVTSIEVSVGTHEFEKNLEEGARDDSRRDEQSNKSSKRNTRIDLNNLDDLSGLMSEEDMLIAQIMQDNGNTLDYQA